MLRRLLDRLYTFTGILAALCLVGILTIVLLQVGANLLNFITDAALGDPIGASVPSYAEFAGFLLVGASFLSLPFALRHGAHIRVNLILQRLPAKGQRLANIWAFAIGAAMAAFSAYYCWELVFESREFGDLSTGMVAIPIWIPQAPMAIGLSVFAIAMLDGLCTSLFSSTAFEQPDASDMGAE
jgi:TRAP-type C4-dicarboxylate transport system permease small subunit